MDATGIAAAVGGMSQTQAASTAQLLVLKKALQIESENALQLLQSVTQGGYNNPPNLGNRIDTYA